MISISGSTLPATLLAAAGGETVVVSGDIAGFSLSKVYPRPVTVVGGRATGPVTLSGCANLKFVGTIFDGPGTASAHVGVTANNCANLSFDFCEFTDLKRGVSMDMSNGVSITSCAFRGITVDGVDISRSRNVKVVDCDFSAFVQLDPNQHPDAIQAWSRPTALPTADLAILGNRISGQMQGIFLGNKIRLGIDDGGFDNVIIRGNHITGGFPNGIAVVACRGLDIEDNDVDTFNGSQYQSRLTLTGCINVTRRGNTVAPYAGKPGVIDP